MGARVAIVGAGGIGFDVAEFLAHQGESPTLDRAAWYREWGVDPTLAAAGGVEQVARDTTPSPRTIYLLQRKDEALGKRLGKSSGWVHRQSLKDKRVEMIAGVHYECIDDEGLHIRVGNTARLLDVDCVIICAGQEPLRELEAELHEAGLKVHRIGGADVAAELDAKRAIHQATVLALAI